MNRIKLIIIILLINVSSLFSQVDLNIDSLIVFNLYNKSDTSSSWLTESSEHEFEGPGLYIYISIKNIGNNIERIYPLTSKFFITYKYKGKVCKLELLSYKIDYLSSDVVLEPSEKIDFYFAELLFNRNNPFDYDIKNDYTLDLIKTLPTLKVYYEDSMNRLESCIKNEIILKE